MARGKATFKQSDATRALKSAIAAGLQVAEVVVEPSGAIRVVTRDAGEAKVAKGTGWEDAR